MGKTEGALRQAEVRLGGVSTAAVKKATGRSWEEWLERLDQSGAAKLSHAEIARLAHEMGAGDWWSQMVAVSYEQARGLRAVHQKADGFAASVSRTFAAPLASVYAEWADARRRARWLAGAKPTARKATENKSMRITWEDGTNVEVNFYAKGPEKCQASVQHSKLPDAAAVAERKEYWAAALERLRARVER